MILFLQKRKASVPFKVTVFLAMGIFLLGTFMMQTNKVPKAYASALPYMAAPTELIDTTANFNPVVLRGIKFDTNNPFKFNFILDEGDTALSDGELKKEVEKIARQFLAAITVPEEDLWVNLSPLEKDRIISDELSVTDIGRDLLGEDYVLKQLTSSLTYPESPLGKEYWKKIYTRTQEMYGTTDVPINTFNKVWITPKHAVIYENAQGAYIGESHLKVMLEQDYLAQEQNIAGAQRDVPSEKQINNISAQITKEVILPVIENEVNYGKSFSHLRQIYHSVLLASWFKKKLKQTILNDIYVDKKKIAGVDTSDPQIKEKVYNQYLEAYKKGVYNYIRRDSDFTTKRKVNRRYYSGGTDLVVGPTTTTKSGTDPLAPGVGGASKGEVSEAGVTTEGIDNKPGPDMAAAAIPHGRTNKGISGAIEGNTVTRQKANGSYAKEVFDAEKAPKDSSVITKADVRDVPQLAGSITELIHNYRDIITFDLDSAGRMVNVQLPTDLTDNLRILDLARELSVVQPDPQVRRMAFHLAAAIQRARGKLSPNVRNVSLLQPFTDGVLRGIPADNLRCGGAMEQAALGRAADKANAVIAAEIAMSELIYSGLLDLFDFVGHVYLGDAFAGRDASTPTQLDHLQAKLSEIFALDKTKALIAAASDELSVDGYEEKIWAKMPLVERESSGMIDKARREAEMQKIFGILTLAAEAGITHFDIDFSTLADQVLMEALYRGAHTDDNPNGFSPSMKMLIDKIKSSPSMEVAVAWVRDKGEVSDDKLWELYSPKRQAASEKIQVFNAKFSAKAIVHQRIEEAKAIRAGYLPEGFRALSGVEDAHTDLKFLENKPSEPESVVAFLLMLRRELLEANKQFKADYGYDLPELTAIKWSPKTGTSHGTAGIEANIGVFALAERYLALPQVKEILGGEFVLIRGQHGASKCTTDQYADMGRNAEDIHFATGIANKFSGTMAEEFNIMTDTVGDLLQLLLKPDRANITDRLNAYLEVIGKDADWLMDYVTLPGVEAKIKRFRSAEFGGKNDAQTKFFNILAKEGITSYTLEGRRRLTHLILTDPEEGVPSDARSKLKDLVKHVYRPLLPYFLSMPQELRDPVMNAVQAWMGDAINELGIADSFDKLVPYLPQEPLVLRPIPADFVAEAQEAVQQSLPLIEQIDNGFAQAREAFDGGEYQLAFTRVDKAIELLMRPEKFDAKDDPLTGVSNPNEILSLLNSLGSKRQLYPRQEDLQGFLHAGINGLDLINGLRKLNGFKLIIEEVDPQDVPLIEQIDGLFVEAKKALAKGEDQLAYTKVEEATTLLTRPLDFDTSDDPLTGLSNPDEVLKLLNSLKLQRSRRQSALWRLLGQRLNGLDLINGLRMAIGFGVITEEVDPQDLPLTNKQIDSFFDRAEEHSKHGRDSYALKEIDKAIELLKWPEKFDAKGNPLVGISNPDGVQHLLSAIETGGYTLSFSEEALKLLLDEGASGLELVNGLREIDRLDPIAKKADPQDLPLIEQIDNGFTEAREAFDSGEYQLAFTRVDKVAELLRRPYDFDVSNDPLTGLSNPNEVLMLLNDLELNVGLSHRQKALKDFIGQGRNGLDLINCLRMAVGYGVIIAKAGSAAANGSVVLEKKNKVAINGGGRIGMLSLRVWIMKKMHGEPTDLDVVAMNDLQSPQQLAYKLKYDSNHGELKDVGIDVVEEGNDNFLVINAEGINNHRIQLFSERDPTQLPWGQLGIGQVWECTGIFRDKEAADLHRQAGAKKVIVSAPGKGLPTIVFGVNQGIYDPAKHDIVSNASCTTNDLAPVIKVLNDTLGVQSAMMNTTHATTNDQKVGDAPHSDPYRSRGAIGAMIIPTITGAAKTTGKVIPELDGKIDGASLRIPTKTVSATTITINVKKDTTVAEVNAILKEASETEGLKGILAYTDEKKVGVDFLTDPHSSTVAGDFTKVVVGTMVQVLSWYDNEWGFANRMVDLGEHMADADFAFAEKEIVQETAHDTFVKNELKYLRRKGGEIEQAAEAADLSRIATALNRSEKDLKNAALYVAKFIDILTVEGRLAIGEGLPFLHARKGIFDLFYRWNLSESAITTGIQLFLHKEITSEQRGRAIFHDALHVVVPKSLRHPTEEEIENGAVDPFPTDQDIKDHLVELSKNLGEKPPTSTGAYDMAAAQSSQLNLEETTCQGGNWKRHLENRKEAKEKIDRFEKKFRNGIPEGAWAGIAVQNEYVAMAGAAWKDSALEAGVQSIFFRVEENQENVVRYLKRRIQEAVDAGATWANIAHSIHRAMGKGLTDLDANILMHAILNDGRLMPWYTVEVSDGGDVNGRTTQQEIDDAVNIGLAGITAEQLLGVPITIEPTRDISTPAEGKAVNLVELDTEKIKKRVDMLRLALIVKYGDIARRFNVGYGASIARKNARAIFSIPGVNNGLAGGESQNEDVFMEVIEKAQQGVEDLALYQAEDIGEINETDSSDEQEDYNAAERSFGGINLDGEIDLRGDGQFNIDLYDIPFDIKTFKGLAPLVSKMKRDQDPKSFFASKQPQQELSYAH
ncbi:MAG: hypothetical protein GY858_04105 [Candidatus Omnitrophica bacterium]|nr:hypothetical protein [Candidatus Omnitrophota bacterium]